MLTTPLGRPASTAGFGQGQCGEWRELRRLQNHRVARRQGWRDLPCQHEQREVPRDDLAAHAHGAIALELGFRELGPTGMMIEMARHQRHVDVAAFADGLAIVHGFENGEEALALLDVAGKGIEMFGALKAG
jgi:hypothetical protein